MNNKMAISIYLSIIELKNKQTEQKQNHRHREPFNGCEMGRSSGGWTKRQKYYEVQIGSYRIALVT